MTTTRYPADTRTKPVRIAAKLSSNSPAKTREQLDADHLAELARDPHVQMGV